MLCEGREEVGRVAHALRGAGFCEGGRRKGGGEEEGCVGAGTWQVQRGIAAGMLLVVDDLSPCAPLSRKQGGARQVCFVGEDGADPAPQPEMLPRLAPAAELATCLLKQQCVQQDDAEAPHLLGPLPPYRRRNSAIFGFIHCD